MNFGLKNCAWLPMNLWSTYTLIFQLALNGHDGAWYLEKPNHIPESYHKPLGIEPLIASPRSESNDVLHVDDDNSNSMMSANSDQVTGSNFTCLSCTVAYTTIIHLLKIFITLIS